LSDAVDRGITVTELAPMEQAIDVSPDTTAAFVGRALRGPLNKPVLVRDFGEFRRRFGDIWSRSSLGPAVRQFFQHGGRRLYIVRVANNARGAMLCLPASGSALVLRTVEPGSTERVRAAIDFDGIDDDELFNLTLQRIDPATGHVMDQELFRHADYREDADNFIADLLLTSKLARVEHPYPSHRPEPTQGPNTRFDDAYIEHAQEGADGQELSDYDLIGSRHEETGLFALQQLENLDLLYLPPRGKGRDLGPASLLAAELFCRERGAMLIVDPPADWTTPAEAVAGVRELGLASPNAYSYFPRMYRREDDNSAPRAVGGALAGLTCKLDRTVGPWQALDQQGMGFSRELIAAFDIDTDDAQTLSREGLNPIAMGPAGRARLFGSVTMGRGSESHRKFASLPVRRLCLQIVNSIDQATRWAVYETDETPVAESIRSLVKAYLSALEAVGAFESDRFIVECDDDVCHHDSRQVHGVTILVGFHPLGCKEPVSFTLHQTIAGCRVASTAFAPVMENCA
jgi:phage tail sheath protein FI